MKYLIILFMLAFLYATSAFYWIPIQPHASLLVYAQQTVSTFGQYRPPRQNQFLR